MTSLSSRIVRRSAMAVAAVAVSVARSLDSLETFFKVYIVDPGPTYLRGCAEARPAHGPPHVGASRALPCLSVPLAPLPSRPILASLSATSFQR